MSSTAGGAATRGAAASNRGGPRRGRRGEPAWRDVARAVRLGKKYDAYSVETRGVRVVFRMAVYRSPQEIHGDKAQEQPARRRQQPTASAAAKHKASGPSSAQRRSARRLQEFLQLKGAHTQGGVYSQGSTSEGAVEPAQVEPDVRKAEAAHSGAAAIGGGRKRAADETSAHEPQPSPPHRAVAKSLRPSAPTSSTTKPTDEQHAVVERTTRRAASPSRSRSTTPRASPERVRPLTPHRAAGDQEPPSGPASRLTTRPAAERQAVVESMTGHATASPMPRSPDTTRVTCRTCGGTQPGNPGQWCKCEAPCWYDRQVPKRLREVCRHCRQTSYAHNRFSQCSARHYHVWESLPRLRVGVGLARVCRDGRTREPQERGDPTTRCR